MNASFNIELTSVVEPLTVREIEEIVSIDDLALRNLLITHGYYSLKVSMAELLGTENVNWCAFAMWASRTAGRFIRGEFLPGALRSLKERFHGTRMWSLVERALRPISHNIAEGNRMVFADIAPLYARMIATFGSTTEFDQGVIDRFVAELRPGRVEDGGQDLLIAASRNYYKAMFETDSKKKAELILLANNQVGLHEQTRLQSAIDQAFFAPIAGLFNRGNSRTCQGIRRFGSRMVARVVRPVFAMIKRNWASLSTRWFMTLELPGRSLCLGKDLESNTDEMFPSQLAEIENPELRALLDELDFTPNTTAGSAAKNWADLGERMNFIVDLFRSHQQDHSLFSEPFSVEEVAAVLA